MWVNGTSAGTGTSSASLNLALGSGVWVGNNASASCNYKGYISNIRVVKGVAVYTGAFTPPTSPLAATQSAGTNISAITGTQTSLLTCQSNRFRDASTNNFSITTSGSPSVVAFSPFNPAAVYNPATHGGSAYFDGSGDYLYLNDVDIFNFDTKPFTVECWVYPTASVATGYYYVISKWRTAPNKEIIFGLASNNGTWSYVYTTDGGTDKIITDPTAIVPYCWTHYAVSRTANTISLFRNGVRVATTTETGSLYNTSGYGITIAAHEHDRGSNFPGYVAGLRAVRGTAVYDATQTTITVPSAPLDVVSNTTLLLNFTDAGVYDASGKNVLETVGDAKISTTQSKWGSTSIKFDGTGDWLTNNNFSNPLLAFGSGDYTIEGWVYSNDVTSDKGILQISDTSGGFKVSTVNIISITTRLGVVRVVNGGSTTPGTTSVTTGQWFHFALVRNSGVSRLYINGSQDAGFGNKTDSTTYTGTYIVIGGYESSAYLYNGYIQDLRITRYARYTANFNPPTQPHQLL